MLAFFVAILVFSRLGPRWDFIFRSATAVLAFDVLGAFCLVALFVGVAVFLVIVVRFLCLCLSYDLNCKLAFYI